MRILMSVLLIATVWFARPAVGEELRPQLDDMVEHFLKVLYGSEYGFTNTPGVVSKWQSSPVNIIIQGNPTQEMANWASRHLSIVSKLTKIKFRQAKPGAAGPSIDLIFLKRADMGKIKIPGQDPVYVQTLASDPTMVCYFLNWHLPPEKIIKAIVVINNERESARIGSCLLEELTQVMGLPNDVQTYWTTLFNPNDSALQHSPWDMLYLKTLYDPRLKPGMRPQEAKGVVREIFRAALAKSAK